MHKTANDHVNGVLPMHKTAKDHAKGVLPMQIS